MSILSRVQENKATLEAEIKDSLGSSFINESGIYSCKVEKAFLQVSEKGAIGIVVQYSGEGMIEDTMWITNKEGQTYYNKNGKDMPMPSYVDAKKLNYLLTGEMLDSITKLGVEERIIKWYKYADDPENEGKKKKVDTEIQAEVLKDWIGKEVKLAVQMVQKEGWDKDAKKPSGVGAVTKEGVAITDPIIIAYFDVEDNRSASEKFDNKESIAYDKMNERLTKTPIRFFKPKKAGAKAPSNTGVAVKSTAKPSLF